MKKLLRHTDKILGTKLIFEIVFVVFFIHNDRNMLVAGLKFKNWYCQTVYQQKLIRLNQP